MSFKTRKFKELVLYIAQRQEADQTFGRIKLAKLLFFSDFEAYGRLGEPITGATYQKLKWGPAARQYLPVAAEMEAEGDLSERTRDYPGRTQHQPVANRSANLTVFSSEEISLVDEIIDEHQGMTAVDISEKSHRLMGWRIARQQERIPYESVFVASGARPQDVKRAKELALEKGWAGGF